MVNRMTSRLNPTKLQLALIEAALRIIDEKGHQALRARELTQAAGCALGGLYTAFADMDALALAVKMRILDELDAAMALAAPRPAVAAAADPADSLLALAGAYVDFATSRKRRWQMLFLYKLANDADAPDWYQSRLAEIFAHIDTPLRALHALADPARRDLAGRALFASVHGIVILGLEGKLGRVPEDYVRAQIEVLVRSAARGLAGG